MNLLECLQEGGEKVKNGEGRGDRHLTLEEGQVVLQSKPWSATSTLQEITLDLFVINC